MSHEAQDARERAVWERVRAGRDIMMSEQSYIQPRQEVEPEMPEWPEMQPPCKPEKPACKPEKPACKVTPEQLMEWICHECEDACLYRHLASCLPQCARRCLLELAADEQCHARRLSAHYYAMTGRCARVQAQYTPTHCPMELLRRRYQEELDGAAAYLDAARCAAGALAELLGELSRDEARHSRMVMCLLECTL